MPVAPNTETMREEIVVVENLRDLIQEELLVLSG